jgi:6-pyruvoyl-tetrahydropterin synthase
MTKRITSEIDHRFFFSCTSTVQTKIFLDEKCKTVVEKIKPQAPKQKQVIQSHLL